MEIKFKAVVYDTFRKVCMLTVKENQINFIESNAYSIAESKFNDEWNPVGIYMDDMLIGFAMYGYISSEKRVWLDRFMIDGRFQGKGYGKSAIKELINKVFEDFKCTEIYLSIFDENSKALKLYIDLGFKGNGELDYGGENVMVLNLDEYLKKKLA